MVAMTLPRFSGRADRCVVAQPYQHDPVEGGVGLSVSTPVEAMADGLARGRLDRRGPAQHREGGLGVRAVGVVAGGRRRTRRGCCEWPTFGARLQRSRHDPNRRQGGVLRRRSCCQSSAPPADSRALTARASERWAVSGGQRNASASACEGVLKPRVCRGRPLSSAAMASRAAWSSWRRSAPLGR
jgi:hypothetical protein